MAFKKLVIASGQVSGASHSDFPILIQPSKMTGWGALTLAEAESIRIYTDEAKTNEVAREVVSADEIHCKVPTLTSSTELYVDYDGVRSDLSPGATYGRNAVWSDYGLVIHGNDDTSSTVVDSSGNADGIKRAANRPIESTGYINKAQENVGSGDYIQVPSNAANSDIYAGGGNVSFWVYHKSSPTSFSGSSAFTAATQKGGGVFVFFGFTTFAEDQSGIRFLVTFTGTNANWREPGLVPFPTTEWVNVSISYDNSSTSNEPYIAFGGASVTLNSPSPPSGTAVSDVGDDIFLLNRTAKDRTINGLMGEIRFCQSYLSPDRITTEHNNQNDVASFWGTVEDAGGDPPEPVANTGFFAFM